MTKIIAIDIGGTNTRIALFDENHQKLDHTSFSTNVTDAVATFSKICDFINKYPEVTIAGISAPGPTDYQNGIFGEPVNVKWPDFKFFDFIKDHTNIKTIKADNDANLMALAHHRYFKQGKEDITQFFTISTGLGAGLVINNKIFSGTNFAAQEVAKLPVAWIHKSGKNLPEGSLELFAAGSGIEFWGKKEGFNNAKEVFEQYKSNEKAKAIIDNGIDALANAIAVTASLINPNLFVFDGSVARHNKWYVNAAIKKAKPKLFENQYLKTSFKFAEMDDDSALIGAVILAQEHAK